MYLGKGGITMHGVLPTASKIGIVDLTIFFKIVIGQATTSPFKWKLPPLLKGRAVVPSNCVKWTDEFPYRSRTMAEQPCSVIFLTSVVFVVIFSLEATHPCLARLVTFMPALAR
jgi:hypothetical protein